MKVYCYDLFGRITLSGAEIRMVSEIRLRKFRKVKPYDFGTLSPVKVFGEIRNFKILHNWYVGIVKRISRKNLPKELREAILSSSNHKDFYAFKIISENKEINGKLFAVSKYFSKGNVVVRL